MVSGNDKKVNPSYYTRGSIQTIEVIEDWGLGFHLANAVKYISRYGYKTQGDTLDLEKAIWYIQRFIESEREGKSNDS